MIIRQRLTKLCSPRLLPTLTCRELMFLNDIHKKISLIISNESATKVVTRVVSEARERQCIEKLFSKHNRLLQFSLAVNGNEVWVNFPYEEAIIIISKLLEIDIEVLNKNRELDICDLLALKAARLLALINGEFKEKVSLGKVSISDSDCLISEIKSSADNLIYCGELLVFSERLFFVVVVSEGMGVSVRETAQARSLPSTRLKLLKHIPVKLELKLRFYACQRRNPVNMKSGDLWPLLDKINDAGNAEIVLIPPSLKSQPKQTFCGCLCAKSSPELLELIVG